MSCRATRCNPSIQKYLGITLLPQAGVALGMAAEAAELSDGHMVRNVVLFSVLVYELVGPTLTKLALTAAGKVYANYLEDSSQLYEQLLQDFTRCFPIDSSIEQ